MHRHALPQNFTFLRLKAPSSHLVLLHTRSWCEHSQHMPAVIHRCMLRNWMRLYTVSTFHPVRKARTPWNWPSIPQSTGDQTRDNPLSGRPVHTLTNTTKAMSKTIVRNKNCACVRMYVKQTDPLSCISLVVCYGLSRYFFILCKY